MAAGAALTISCILLVFGCSSAAYLGLEGANATAKICKEVDCNNCRIKSLEDMLTGCVVVFGNVRVLLMEQTHRIDYSNTSFPLLREVTGYVAFYRVKGLDSIGSLFPNLARIRGRQVLYNYALIIYDMSDLGEVGLSSLLKIDQGGVIVWAVPHACFVNTINWQHIAPNSRHILNPVEDNLQCTRRCTCSDKPSLNYCWNTFKCQRYPDGVEGYSICDEQCFGCRSTNTSICSVCREYTFKGECVPQCPLDTLVLPDNGYCITGAECSWLGGWPWNRTCVFNCTIGYTKVNYSNGTVCEPCHKCEETCENLTIQTLENVLNAGRCVHIRGYLSIHIRFLVNGMEELKRYLGQIQDVSDYIVIYGSLSITSLDFLSSLRTIGGENLRNETHSLIVYDMASLQSLFSENVTKTLQVKQGTLHFYNNPMLCLSEIDKIQEKFPLKPGPFDLPQGTNGYSGGCTSASIGLDVNVINETSALVNFTHVQNPHAHYSILYVRLPQGSRKVFVPETCSDSEWHAYNIPFHLDTKRVVVLTSLRPASSYALCVEKYDPETNILARSNIFNFTTPVGKPEPPFIFELVAKFSSVIVLRWVDHKIYRSHIVRYELDVTLVDIYERDVMARDHCLKREDSFEEIDYFRHAVVMRPPPEYDRGCESMCGVLSNVPAGAMVEEYFDVCSSIQLGCDISETAAPKNSSFGNFTRTLSLNVTGPRNQFEVGNLAPFRDYRFRLRACSVDQCSRFARGVVRTLRSKEADIPNITYVSAAETGHISIKWNPPEVMNGAVLSYTITILPSVKYDEPAQLLPQVWCRSSDTRSVVVKAIQAKKYIVRVCSTTLASRLACSEKHKVITTSEGPVTYFSWWWVGIIFGILIYTTSLVIGFLWRKKREIIYELPLLEHMEISQSEAPSAMMSDFMYTIPLRDLSNLLPLNSQY